MELLKRNVHINNREKLVAAQITVNDDFIVPDTKNDIEKIIAKKCRIKIEAIGINKGRLLVRGALELKLLYCANDNSYNNMQGAIVFEEMLNCKGIEELYDTTCAGNEIAIEGGSIRVVSNVENLHIGIINTRKISVKAVVLLEAIRDLLKDIEAAVDIKEQKAIGILRRKKKTVQPAILQKDIFRIKDEIDIGQSRPNIGEILWECANLTGIRLRPMVNQVGINGDIRLFILYRPQEENYPYQWIESHISFNGVVDVGGCNEELIPDIHGTLEGLELELHNDYNGEPRNIALEGIVGLNMSFYKEEDIEYLADVYCSHKELIPVYEENTFTQLLSRTVVKSKVYEKLSIEDNGHNVLQVCSCDGVAAITDKELSENGINIRGQILVSILYITDDDRCPFAGATSKLSFEQFVDIPKMVENIRDYIHIGPVVLSATMTGNMQLEIKGTVELSCIFMETSQDKTIKTIEEKPLDMEVIGKLPGIVGYMVKEGDTLWNIAKSFYTSIESIKEINNLKSDNIKPGEMLILVKEMCL